MKKILPANSVVRLILAILISITFLAACKKSDNNTVYAAPPDLTTKITSSVSGFVTDENDAAVKNATVQFGSATLSTDKYGYFEAKNIEVVKDAATVTVSKPGYFKGIKTYMATAGKSAFFRIKLIPKTIAGTVNGSTGGTVTLSNGLTVNLPANAVVNATTNAAYTGTINVAAFWINPTSTDLPNIMPGDLRGVNTDGNVQLLTTYGMAAVELTGSGGELLQIATGKKAALSIPIPTAGLSSAPPTIPLWYFDEAQGLWKEEGSATKSGSKYVGEVSHFSFWNYDMPTNYVQFSCTVVTAGGQPIQYAIVKISSVANPFNFRFGITNNAGYVNGAVPDNTQLLLEIFASTCSGAAYSQTLTTTNLPVVLGNITLGPAASVTTVSGTITNCSDKSVTNGYVILVETNQTTRYDADNNGTFNFPKILCGNTAQVVLIGEDASTLQQSNPLTVTLTAGTTNVKNLKACGISTQEYFYYTEDGVSHLLTMPLDSISLGGQIGTPEGWAYAFERKPGNTLVMVNYDNHNPSLNSYQYISRYYSPALIEAIPVSPATTTLHITEFGTLGQFMTGTFSGIMAEVANQGKTHTVSVTFRVRRK